MAKTLSLRLIKTGLGVLVCLNCIHSLTHTSQAATLRLSPDISWDNLSLEQISNQNFIETDLLSQLVPGQESISPINEAFTTETITQAISEPSTISLDSIIFSLSQIDLEANREDIAVGELPILPQVDAADVYKGIYDFGTTAAEELSDPISVGVLPPLDAIPTARGGVRTVRTSGGQVRGVPGLSLSQPALPRFGGPVPVIGGPTRNFATPLRQVGLPSATRVQAGHWGDSQVDVFFASLPQQEVVNIDTFVRTVYRTNLSDMIEQIDKSLDLTIDADFNTMPANVFPNNPMPSGEFKRTL
ncbi:hypothetical protein [Crocosphaera sp.]|uniref:hypothetical protein n=1 Tax=Crocosphaera sp. TaxID=2729996 RepID=UPI003F1E9CA1|nr:hypothetical protein [Crocosphaera sp.]